ncbi:phospholipase D-like domain-containing protein [Bradyrhizobium barranii]|uniref:phospholipase D-like domain-containing protein n=1 Tax=Bradyrhizobium barranii TaxID=2992140 RepID=UPI0024AEB0CC|nr:phospholipase D-like domain-containing protein [Bradyrhizobium barranii]WFT94417.1 phospholipase D-like domain-containing protein [Bradyrhizobium barranii]
MESEERRDYNQRFVERLLARRPAFRQKYEEAIARQAAEPAMQAEGVATEGMGIGLPPVDVVNETIVKEERPVLFVKDDWIDIVNVELDGEEARELVTELNNARVAVGPVMPLIGRIDVFGFPGSLDFIGTGWFVAADVVVTNRHVAQLIAQQQGASFVFTRGVAGQPVSVSLNTLHEFDDVAAGQARTFAIKDVLYIEKIDSPNDIAFLRVARRIDGAKPGFITVCDANLAADAPVVTIGYPAKAPKRIIPDQNLMKELYRDRYDVKRAAPGLIIASQRNDSTEHDCTTLGGNSGSVIIDPRTGKAAGLHYAGLYKQANYAVPASVLNDYIRRERWREPPTIETRTVIQPVAPKVPAVNQAAGSVVAPFTPGEVSFTIPLTIKVSLGQPVATSAPGATLPQDAGPADAESAVAQFWDHRPEGVLAARVGFLDDGDAIGDTPCIAASVLPSRLAQVAATGPSEYHGLPVRYLPASVAEQIEARPEIESVDSTEYDDDARTGRDFSFAEVNEEMTVRAHVGPEYSWDELNAFLSGARRALVSAMYEFHALHIKDAIQDRLRAGVSLKLVLDNATFSKVKDPDEEFDRIPTFKAWERYSFDRIVAPEGLSGLISDSYHIKVTARDDGAFWLSSGNWKPDSSQPIITQEQRDNAADEDLPGNREWHVVIYNETLTNRFRNHILQDLKRSADLGGGILPRSKMEEVEVPQEEAVVFERRPPGAVLEPLEIKRKVKVKPVLTPDKEGEIYSEAVLDLINSAQESLLFQIPYIAMPSNPRQDRGFIDELIKALTKKLKTLDDARVILRTGGQKFSDPTHAAWYFKSKGVDIASRLRRMDDTHTKGMIVDGKRMLLGSHNWSKPGVSLNRDASLIFDDQELSMYYAKAFEIDWRRANPIRPKRYVKPEGVAIPGAESVVAPLFKLIRLQDLPTE